MLDEHHAILQAIARSAIENALGGSASADESAAWLTVPGASFVTLSQNGKLCGCVGTLEACRALVADVKHNACGAAFHDPRFSPLALPELAGTDLHVSVLSPLTPVQFTDEADALAQLRPGVDGLVLEYGHHRATFLPQVWAQLPEPRAFLAQLKHKAGLPTDFWAEGVRLKRYENL